MINLIFYYQENFLYTDQIIKLSAIRPVLPHSVLPLTVHEITNLPPDQPAGIPGHLPHLRFPFSKTLPGKPNGENPGKPPQETKASLAPA